MQQQPLPTDERLAIELHLRDLDRLEGDLTEIERELARLTSKEYGCQRLMSFAGIKAAIGNIDRFSSPQKLVRYFGLSPSVRRSGLAPAHHCRIIKRGRAHARAMLFDAAWAAAKPPGPLGKAEYVKASCGADVARTGINK